VSLCHAGCRRILKHEPAVRVTLYVAPAEYGSRRVLLERQEQHHGRTESGKPAEVVAGSQVGYSSAHLTDRRGGLIGLDSGCSSAQDVHQG
jgi:hypothetical protein